MPHARRLRQVVLMHMPIGDARERAVLEAATAVVTTSDWTRRRLERAVRAAGRAGARGRARRRRRRPRARDRGRRSAAVRRGGDARQGARRAARRARDGDRPAVAVHVRGQPRSRPGVRRPRAPARDHGLGDRVRFPGPRTGPELDRTYAAADLLVLASHAETYGMVVTEALARGVPVVATDVGGVTRGARARGTDRAARPARRPGGPRRRAAGAGSATPSCASGCDGPRRERRASLRAWAGHDGGRRRRPARGGVVGAAR